jgi:CDP-diacylglycerol--glycerol-3-phosphate 3-phosphatidyltransferase
MSAVLRHLPAALTGARLLLAIPLWGLALANRQRALAVGLVLALLTDVLDGPAARWLGQSSEAGARFDSLADKVLTLSVLAWLLLLHPAIMRDAPTLGLAALLLGLASWLIGLLQLGRVTGLHLRVAQAAGAAQALFVLHTFWGGAYSPALFRLAASLWCLAAAAEIIAQLRAQASRA